MTLQDDSCRKPAPHEGFMTNTPHEDPILEAAVERALAPLLGRLSPELLDEFRKSLRLGLSTHPKAQDILHRLRARPILLASSTLSVPEVQTSPGRSGEAGGSR